MSKVLVLYYSAYGQIEAMANALAEGAREAGADDDIKRVPELVSEGIVRKSHYELASIAKVEDLADYDAIELSRLGQVDLLGEGAAHSRWRSLMVGLL
jgi:NAD(P)H dehydrogenase (quinone)